MIYDESNLVVQQIMNKCDAVSDNTIAYRELYNTLEGSFDGCELKHIGCESNVEADKLANIGSIYALIHLVSSWSRLASGKSKPKHPPTLQNPQQTQGVMQLDNSRAPVAAEIEPAPEGPMEVMLIEPAWTHVPAAQGAPRGSDRCVTNRLPLKGLHHNKR